MINVWLWVRWYTEEKLWGRKHKRGACANTHSSPDRTDETWLRFLTGGKREGLYRSERKKRGGQKKLDTMGKYATFQTKYWQNVGRKISQWYKEHFQRKVFIERLRRVDQTLLIKGHCTETIIMCWTLTTNINAYDRGFLIRLKGQQPFKKKKIKRLEIMK